MHPPKAPSNAEPISVKLGLALLLGLMVMLGPFSVDTMFPAFAQMEVELGADSVAIQQTLSVYLFSFAIMSLLHGPLSDALGRKPVLLGGLVVFGLASVACANAPSIEWLLAFRALQGLSAGVGMIIGRAVIRDRYQDADAQRLLSMVTMVFAIAPALAPVTGGWIMQWSDWRGIFYFLSLLAAALLVLVLLGLRETHPKAARTQLSSAALIKSYAAIFKDASFLRLALVGSFNFGSIFLYIASAPVVIRKFLHMGEQDFVWLFAPVISGMLLGSIISTRLAGRFTMRTQIHWAFLCTLSATGGNFIYTQYVDEITLPWALIPLFVNAIGSTIAFPVLMLAMLDRHPEQKGAASSSQAFVNQSNNAIFAGLLAPLLSQSPQTLALGALGSAFISLSIWRWHRKAS